MKLLNVATGLAVGAWAYLLLARGGFWRIRHRVPKASASQDAGVGARVVAVVPARNEAEVVSECIASLVQQQGVELRIVLVDDGSTDGTAEIARLAADAPEDRLMIIRGRALPAGWSGKLWAVAQGVERAKALTLAKFSGRSAELQESIAHKSSAQESIAHEGQLEDANGRDDFAPDFLFFTDADIRHAPDSLAKLVAIANDQDADLASFMVKLSCRTVPERLLIPAFVFFFFMLYPPRWTAEPRKRTAGAAGGSILIRPAALERAGGIEAIRGEIIDDCALARAVKQSGGKVWLGLTDSALSLREYRTFEEIGRMIARSAFNQLDHSAALLVLSVGGLALSYILPVAALFSGSFSTFLLGGLGWAAMTMAYLPMTRFYRLHPVWAITLPAAAAFYMGATVVSAIQYWSGRGGQWKGRAQDAKQLRSEPRILAGE